MVSGMTREDGSGMGNLTAKVVQERGLDQRRRLRNEESTMQRRWLKNGDRRWLRKGEWTREDGSETENGHEKMAQRLGIY